MFVVTEADAAAIAGAMKEGGPLAATTELRRRFPGIVDAAEATRCAQTIAGWQPLPQATARVPTQRKARTVRR